MTTRVYKVPELMIYILNFSTIEGIVTVGRANNRGRSYAREVIRELVKRVLDPYIPAPSKPHNFECKCVAHT